MRAPSIDCDLHPPTPRMNDLLPYLSDYWRETVINRGIGDLDLADYPAAAPISCRPDWRNTAKSPPLHWLQAHALDAFKTDVGILHPLHGAPTLHNEDLAAELCKAVNDWVAAEWLDKDDRLRASILVPIASPKLAVEEIERRAHDRRFVQVLVLAGGDSLLGRRHHWPIFEAAARHAMSIGIHAGSAYRHAPTSNGWSSYLIEDHVAYSQTFQSQLLSLIGEGVFGKFPTLRFVLIEAGFAWLPGFLWRADKEWQALRREIPWVDRAPADLVRERVRVTLQPAEAPPTSSQMERIVNQIGSDEVLLYSTDYPHWHFDGSNPLPAGFSDALAKKIKNDNPLAVFERIRP